MARYMVLVIVSPAEEDIEQAVEDLMEPYSRWLELPVHKDYLEYYQVNQAASRYHIRGDELELIVSKMREAGNEDVGIDEKGIYRLTTRNPLGRWDAWCIGGCWDGVIQSKRRGDEHGYNVGLEHEQLQYNKCIVAELPKFFLVYEVITPDGIWHSWGEWEKPMRSSFDQMIELNELAEQYAKYIAVCVDCHF